MVVTDGALDLRNAGTVTERERSHKSRTAVTQVLPADEPPRRRTEAMASFTPGLKCDPGLGERSHRSGAEAPHDSLTTRRVGTSSGSATRRKSDRPVSGLWALIAWSSSETAPTPTAC